MQRTSPRVTFRLSDSYHDMTSKRTAPSLQPLLHTTFSIQTTFPLFFLPRTTSPIRIMQKSKILIPNHSIKN
uniref:Uncharacterized protein n=1 Tax=Picea glauca TaxID=3330 RepID=A0A101LZ06_PICGL|nr:hypothetical protein ABT39_MTgene4966 [Picea glauca]QHR90398.1 hypothetical protein Q903MT_gene4421 [Picea sitchensis]